MWSNDSYQKGDALLSFFLIDGGQRARESETRAEAVTVIKGSVGGKDKSEMWDNEATFTKMYFK